MGTLLEEHKLHRTSSSSSSFSFWLLQKLTMTVDVNDFVGGIVRRWNLFIHIHTRTRSHTCTHLSFSSQIFHQYKHQRERDLSSPIEFESRISFHQLTFSFAIFCFRNKWTSFNGFWFIYNTLSKTNGTVKSSKDNA